MIESGGPWSTNSSAVIYEKILIDSIFYNFFTSPFVHLRIELTSYTQSLLGSLVSHVTLIRMNLRQSFKQQHKQKLQDFLTWKD